MDSDKRIPPRPGKKLGDVARMFAVGEAIGKKYKHRPSAWSVPDDIEVENLLSTSLFASIADGYIRTGELISPAEYTAAICEIPATIRGGVLNCLVAMPEFSADGAKCALELWENSGRGFAAPIFVPACLSAGFSAGIFGLPEPDVSGIVSVTSADPRALAVGRAMTLAAYRCTTGARLNCAREDVFELLNGSANTEVGSSALTALVSATISCKCKPLTDLDINDDLSCGSELRLLCYLLKAMDSAETNGCEISIKKALMSIAVLGGYSDVNCAMAASLITSRWPGRIAADGFIEVMRPVPDTVPDTAPDTEMSSDDIPAPDTVSDTEMSSDDIPAPDTLSDTAPDTAPDTEMSSDDIPAPDTSTDTSTDTMSDTAPDTEMSSDDMPAPASTSDLTQHLNDDIPTSADSGQKSSPNTTSPELDAADTSADAITPDEATDYSSESASDSL